MPVFKLATTFLLLLFLVFVSTPSAAQTTFVNWETPVVHPIALTPDGNRLLVVNLPDARLEIFVRDAAGMLEFETSVAVGLDPVSVRARTSNEVWVVSHISDAIQIVDLAAGRVTATIPTGDEPCDVVFAGTPERAFVSCSQVNEVWVFDPENLAAAPTIVPIAGEDPRALAVSGDGTRVLAAVFESGNGSTVLAGDGNNLLSFPPNVVADPLGPYGGVNPPPNNGSSFEPPLHPSLLGPIPNSLIVRKNDNGDWVDDNGSNWTDLVSGANASRSGRPTGWDLSDHDIASIDVTSLSVTYVDRLMNTVHAICAAGPGKEFAAVGVEAFNEIRYEPNLNGAFAEMRLALGDASPMSATPPARIDLNDHLVGLGPTVPQPVRDLSIGDPRAVISAVGGLELYIAGLGSNAVIRTTNGGTRIGSPIEVGAGPSGLAIDEIAGVLYCFNRFDNSISIIDILTSLEIDVVRLHDSTPVAIREGRPLLYDSHRTSGTGHLACATCHLDARMDRLAWDLGDPSAPMQPFEGNCIPIGSCADWHPMKGPMTTQTLQDIIGKEPHHWRGDRTGIEAFNPAFVGLLGDDVLLTPAEMQQFEDFLATIHYPPNPYRNLDNSLPTALDLTGHFTSGRFGPPGQPLPPGDAVAGLDSYRTDGLDGADCVSCHSLPTGAGSNIDISVPPPSPFPPGPDGETSLLVNANAGSFVGALKVPQLRNLYEKTGFETTQLTNTQGFGFLHDGKVDSISRFVSLPVFSVTSDQQVADLVAFMLSFSGSDLPQGNLFDLGELPGVPSLDTHAAVGQQVTLNASNALDPATNDRLDDLIALADSNEIGLVAHAAFMGQPRGSRRTATGFFQTDRASEIVDLAFLKNIAALDSAVMFTAVPKGMEFRLGVDRDQDGFLDRDELDQCADPADPASTPLNSTCGSFIRGHCDGVPGSSLSDVIALLTFLFAGAPVDCEDACDIDDSGEFGLVDAIGLLGRLFQGAGPLPEPASACGADPTADTLSCDTGSGCP